jgi:hypothetical protein
MTPILEAIKDLPIMKAKGMPVAVQTVGTYVEIWFRSPTGDSSDSHILRMPCNNTEQAEEIANNWRNLFGF